uniref:Uncharacterized protein n=1 Tax=Fagus sylvatica TaxID=28930 RepID=A0A2N9FDU1_FAGSY
MGLGPWDFYLWITEDYLAIVGCGRGLAWMGVGFKRVDNDGGLLGNWTEALGLFERVWPKGGLTGLLRSERLTMSVGWVWRLG